MGLSKEERDGIQYDITGHRVPIVPDHTWTFLNHREAFPTLPSHRDRVDEISVSLTHNEGGTSGEFMFRWYELGGNRSARLEVFHDAWQVFALSGVAGHLAALDEQHPTVKQIEELLERIGMRNETHKYLRQQEGYRADSVDRAVADLRERFEAEAAHLGKRLGVKLEVSAAYEGTTPA